MTRPATGSTVPWPDATPLGSLDGPARVHPVVHKVGLFPSPLGTNDALTQVREWLAQPPSVLIEPTSRHLGVLAGLLTETGIGGNLVTDADLAALAVEHDATVVTYDSDFGRFRGLTWRPPEG